MNEKRGQISVEYLIIVGFVVFLVVSILGASIFYAFGLRDSIKMNQVSGYADKIISNAETVNFAGHPSKVTVTAYLPEGVQGITRVQDAAGVFLKIDIQTSSGVTKIAFSSDVDFSFISPAPSTNSGTKRFEIQALEGGGVSIEEV